MPRLLLILPSTSYRAAAFVDAARRLGVELTVASDHRSTFDATQPANLLYLDCGNPARVADMVRAFAARHPIDAVFGVDDTTAIAAAHAAAALGLRHASPAACEAARDKHRQRVVLTRAGLPVPAFALHRFAGDLAHAARIAPYPCVLKPTHLAMSRGVIRADDPAQFVAAAERIRAIVNRPDASPEGREQFLVERFIPGDELALEGVMINGELRVLALFDKPDPLNGPYFEETIYATPSRQAQDAQEEIAFAVQAAAAALGIDRGPVHAEVRRNDRGPWIIEVAARPIGGRCSAVLRFGEDAGVSLEELLLREALHGWDGSATAGVEREPLASAVMMIPVPRAGTLRGVEGISEAKRVPWIDDVVMTVHAGQPIEPLPEGNRYLGFIYAWAGDAPTAVDAVRRAHGKLAFDIV